MLEDRTKRYRFATIACAALATTAVAQTPAAPPPERDIVVTGVPLKTTQAQLAACLARKCPPKEDIDATLAHAENAFVAGDYKMARTALLASLGRNRQYAKTFPVDVSDLLRASSRVAAHLGEKEGYRSNMRDSARVLEAGLPENDPRILAARIEVGDSMARTDNLNTAINIYRSVIKQADKADLPMISGYARLRVASLYSALAEEDPMYREAADKALQTLITERDPRLGRFAAAANVLQARAAAKRGDMRRVDSLIADAKAVGGAVPVLFYAPSIAPDTRGQRLAGGMSNAGLNDVDGQWVDIGFWIAADGKVSDVEILRQSPGLSGDWTKPVVASIAGRRYAAFTPAAGQAGMQRVERYTRTAFWRNDTGTHLRRRDPLPRLEMLDLTR